LINWTINSGFNESSSVFSDYYLLKEKFKDLEQQLDKLEKISSSKFFPLYYIHNKSLDFQLYMLKDTLEFIKSLVRKYSEGFLVETNFILRFARCEKRANSIFSKIHQSLNKNHITE
jgi:hypothetical protein